MRSLYLRIWVTVVVALGLYAAVSVWLMQRHMDQRMDQERQRAEVAMQGRAEAWAELLSKALPGAKAPASEQRAALQEWSSRLRLPMALDDANHACMLDTSTGAILWKDDAPSEGMLVAAFSGAASDLVISADRSGAAKLRRTRSGELLRTFPAHDCISMAFSADGVHAAWIQSDGKAQYISAADGGVVSINTGLQETWSISLSSDGSTVVCGGRAGLIVAHPARSAPILPIPTGDGIVVALAISPDGTRIAAGGNKRLGIFDANTGQEIAVLRENVNGPNLATWSDDGRYLAAADGASPDNSEVVIWDSLLPPQQPAANAATKSR